MCLKGGEVMLSISVKAFADDVRRVWSEIDSRMEEIDKKEQKVLVGRSDEWLHGFWENVQKTILKRSRRLPFMSYIISSLYVFLQKLVILSVFLVFLVMIDSMIDDTLDFAILLGRISVFYLKVGLGLVALSAICWVCRKMCEGAVKGSIAVQQILAKKYNLISQYSEDVNCYAVIMMAASELKLSTRKRTKEDLRIMEKNAEKGCFMMNTADDIPQSEDYDEIDSPE